MSFLDILDLLPAVAKIVEKYLDYQVDLLPIKEDLHDEKEELRSVIHKVKTTRKKRKLLKAYKRLVEFENKHGIMVGDSGEIAIKEIEIITGEDNKLIKKIRRRRKR